MVLFLLILFCFSAPVFSQNMPLDWQKNHSSAGLNITTDKGPDTVIFRKWNQNNNGRQIVITNTSGFVGQKTFYPPAAEGVQTFETHMPVVEYVFLKRNKFLNNDFATIYSGLGLSLSGYWLSNFSVKDGDIEIFLRLPVGIEHFFLKSTPTISYSAEADFYIGHWKVCHEDAGGDEITTRVGMGVTPRFLVSWYFK